MTTEAELCRGEVVQLYAVKHWAFVSRGRRVDHQAASVSNAVKFPSTRSVPIIPQLSVCRFYPLYT